MEKTGNILCDAFIAECEAYAELSGIVSCDAAPIFSKKSALEGAMAEYVFDTFAASVIYNVALGGVKSVLEMRIAFLSEPEVDFSLYDLLYLLDENNFNCYIFPYVESEERMKACVGVLLAALSAYRTQISAIGDDGRLRERAIARKKKEMSLYFHTDIFAEQDTSDSLLLLLQKSWYRVWYVSRFCDRWYRDYIMGNYESAAKSFAKYENKSDYELRLYRFIKALGSGVEYTPVSNECNTYILGKKAFAAKIRPAYVLSYLALFLPLYLAYLLFFLASYYIIYRSALICSSFLGAQMLISPFIAALVSDFFLSDITYRYFAKKSGSAATDAAQTDSGRASRFHLHFVTVICLAAVLLSAKWGVAVYPSGIVDNRSLTPGVSEPFADVVSAKDNGDGYELFFADGNSFVCPKDITEKYILPRIKVSP